MCVGVLIILNWGGLLGDLLQLEGDFLKNKEILLFLDLLFKAGLVLT